MTAQLPCVQIFTGVPEAISRVSLRRHPAKGAYLTVMRFEALASLEHFLSFRRSSKNALHLIDSEGEILIKPSSIKLFYGGPEGEDINGVECQLEIYSEENWERFMRFMHRYAEAHELDYGESEAA